jgi:hypothetical protein
MARKNAAAQPGLFGNRKPTFRLKPPKLKLTENHIEAQVCHFLRVRGWRVDRLHTGGARWPDGTWLQLHPEGTADWLAHRPRESPSCLYIETKAPGKEPTFEQQVFLEQARREGYLAVVADSLEDFTLFYGLYFPKEIAR